MTVSNATNYVAQAFKNVYFNILDSLHCIIVPFGSRKVLGIELTAICIYRVIDTCITVGMTCYGLDISIKLI